MIGWYHWLNGPEFEQTLGDSERLGSLVYMGSQRVRHDWTTTTNTYNQLVGIISDTRRCWPTAIAIINKTLAFHTQGFPSHRMRFLHFIWLQHTQIQFPTWSPILHARLWPGCLLIYTRHADPTVYSDMEAQNYETRSPLCPLIPEPQLHPNFWI